MWLMLQQDKPEDYVISTGMQYSVEEFINIVAEELKIKIKWQGQGVERVGIDSSSGKKIIK